MVSKFSGFAAILLLVGHAPFTRDSTYNVDLILTVTSISLTCRQRHLKCDEEKPRCGRCRRTSRECVPDDLVTFRSGQRVAARAQLRSGSLEVSGESLGSAEHVDVFPKEHQWVETPGTRTLNSPMLVRSPMYPVTDSISVVHQRDIRDDGRIWTSSDAERQH